MLVLSPNDTILAAVVVSTLKNGIFVPPDNINAISKAMERMIENRNSYDSETIHNQISTRFGLTSFGKYLERVYKEVI